MRHWSVRISLTTGAWNKLVAPVVMRQAIINQDIDALANQMDVIKKW